MRGAKPDAVAPGRAARRKRSRCAIVRIPHIGKVIDDGANLELVRALPLLAGLETDRVERLRRAAALHRHSKGKLLFSEGKAPDCLFVLLSGMVELFTSKGKRDAVVLILWPPEIFLAAAALVDEPYLMSARALSPASLLAFDARVVREEARRCPELAGRLTRILAGQFRMTVRHIKDLKLRSGPRRLGAFLLRLVDETGRSGCTDLPVAKATLASRLGLSAESLSRALPLLREHGLLVRGSRVILTDRERFERFCAPDPLIDGRELGLSVTAL